MIVVLIREILVLELYNSFLHTTTTLWGGREELERFIFVTYRRQWFLSQ
jgi:hypothetical protein